ncbi:hypothetical protein [Micromonospora auratinigra]|uniref:hypothetical protein n=1 Tax=Micromonospora auratinigra TaxID=261654 RepID=UPI0012FDB33F|nr:hypothetical protein [Micromonospora auratinigra]
MLANLVAAGVLYLLAVAAGYITADRVLIVVAAFLTLLMAVPLVDTALGRPLDEQGRQMPFALWLLEIAFYLAGFVFVVYLLVTNLFLKP